MATGAPVTCACWDTGWVAEQLDGGVANAGNVVREGGVVLRPAPANVSTLHRLLNHVVSGGFLAPEPLEVREDGREAVGFIAGDVSVPPYTEPWVGSDVTLVSVGRLLRSYHQAVEGFAPVHDAEWSTELADPAGLDPFSRVRLLADAYGLDKAARRSFSSVLMEIEEVALRFVMGRMERGEGAFIRMWSDLGGRARQERKTTWLRQHLSSIEIAFSE